MVCKSSIRQLSQPISNAASLLQKMVVELDEYNEESLVGCGLQRLQEEFAAELATLRLFNSKKVLGDVTPIEEIGVVGSRL